MPQRLMALTPKKFELAVRDHLQSLGFDVKDIGSSGDGGIDLEFEIGDET